MLRRAVCYQSTRRNIPEDSHFPVNIYLYSKLIITYVLRQSDVRKCLVTSKFYGNSSHASLLEVCYSSTQLILINPVCNNRLFYLLVALQS
jgi:hypothetical protein